MRFLIPLLFSAMIISCGTTVGVDYNKETNFDQYTTYNFYPGIESGLNELDDKRIVRITDSLLQLRGFKKSESPQIYINFFAKEGVSNSRNSIGIGIGSAGRNVGVGVSGGIPIGGRNIDQQLTIDFIDVSKDDLVWQAVAEGSFKERVKPVQKEAYYLSVIQKILKKYPPKN